VRQPIEKYGSTTNLSSTVDTQPLAEQHGQTSREETRKYNLHKTPSILNNFLHFFRLVEDILDKKLTKYPNGAFFLFFKVKRMINIKSTIMQEYHRVFFI
jgi:hypothetical protein